MASSIWYRVRRLVSRQKKNKTTEYEVEWEPSEGQTYRNTWVPEKDITAAAIAEFEQSMADQAKKNLKRLQSSTTTAKKMTKKTPKKMTKKDTINTGSPVDSPTPKDGSYSPSKDNTEETSDNNVDASCFQQRPEEGNMETSTIQSIEDIFVYPRKESCYAAVLSSRSDEKDRVLMLLNVQYMIQVMIAEKRCPSIEELKEDLKGMVSDDMKSWTLVAAGGVGRIPPNPMEYIIIQLQAGTVGLPRDLILTFYKSDS